MLPRCIPSGDRCTARPAVAGMGIVGVVLFASSSPRMESEQSRVGGGSPQGGRGPDLPRGLSLPNQIPGGLFSRGRPSAARST
jgi:hypothetical protein